MKKTVLIIALAMMMVLAMGSIALAKNGGSAIVSQSNGWGTMGYIQWSGGSTNTSAPVPYWAGAKVAGSLDALQASGPHANYSTTTVKCAVCHSVHDAPVNSFVLTRATNADIPGGTGSAETVCRLCHWRGSTFSTLVVSFPSSAEATTGQITQHGSMCSSSNSGSCHAGAHGVGASTYGTLAAKLLRATADDEISTATGANTASTGMTSADFALTGGAIETNDQKTIAIGMFCGQNGCHSNSAFVNKDGKATMVPAPGGASSPALRSAHPMMDSNGVITAAGTASTPAGASFSGQIAWAPSNGCAKCHALPDVTIGNGRTAFPHDRALTPYQVRDQTDASKPSGIWLMGGSYNGSADTTWVAGHNYNPQGTDLGSAAYETGFSTASDGVCLRCHRGSTTLGVGLTF